MFGLSMMETLFEAVEAIHVIPLASSSVNAFWRDIWSFASEKIADIRLTAYSCWTQTSVERTPVCVCAWFPHGVRVLPCERQVPRRSRVLAKGLADHRRECLPCGASWVGFGRDAACGRRSNALIRRPSELHGWPSRNWPTTRSWCWAYLWEITSVWDSSFLHFGFHQINFN